MTILIFKIIYVPSYPIRKIKMPKNGVGSRQGSNEGHLPLKVVFHQRSSSTKGHLPPKVVFHQRLSSTKCCLPPKVIIHQRLSYTKGCLPPKFVFHQRFSSTEGFLPLSSEGEICANFLLLVVLFSGCGLTDSNIATLFFYQKQHLCHKPGHA